MLRLFKVLTDDDTTATSQVAPAEADSAVATQVKENRILAPNEVTELTESYRRGATVRELSQRYGVHRHTIDRHLERAGVAKRPATKMTAARVARATELYEQGLSTNQIGRELHVDGSTVWKALKRAGVRMRPPVA
ncbi:hypothetical protein RM780_11355 [Streptomyces sp. DSM 44917]|uniref:Transposase IS30-like HTH domain-containing protein n=1 Tax=Streptomyces boetiae TaxID=3075541 RepID=A0ABU2L7T6_9ACTN|nr:hypothetical protein [Streptomyces sp. DSM 44917]MDT0307557.1 hypothetical protein [Streptomyces sp. DSM 44917]